MAEGTRDSQPLLTVTNGSPTDEEIAALVAVAVCLRAARRRAGADRGSSRWARSARPAAVPGWDRGPDAWRTTALPVASRPVLSR